MLKDPQLVALGAKIKTLRKERGFTQEAFSDHTELDRAYYGSVERGERNIAVINLLKIARGLEVQVGELFPVLHFRRKKSNPK